MENQVTCARCGARNGTAASFCSSCGAALAASAAPVPESSPSGWALATAGMGQPSQLDPRTGPLRTEECAGWWQRLGGYLLDGLILLVLIAIGSGVLAVVALGVTPGLLDELVRAAEDGVEPSDAAIAWFIGWVGLVLLGALAWDVWWTRSRHMGRPGQLVAGYRVVGLDGVERLSTGRAVGRVCAKLLYNLGNFGWIFQVVSAFTIGMSERKQGLHDMIAGTACVRKSALARRGVGPDALEANGGRAEASGPFTHVGTSQPVMPQSPPTGSGPFV